MHQCCWQILGIPNIIVRADLGMFGRRISSSRSGYAENHDEIDPYEAVAKECLAALMISNEVIDENLPCQYFDRASREHIIKII
jgi:hypothetical protein